MYTALFLTIPVLFCMGYFFMGSLPLLVLNHDTPLDARFIRGFFNTYYLALACTATLGTLGYALAGHVAFSAGMVTVAALALILRKTVLPHMDALRTRIENEDTSAATDFRRVHIAGMVFNVVQLAAVVWGMFRVAAQVLQ
jgi:hypothetical protein